MEASIPEWKRNAVVIADDEEEEEKRAPGLLRRAKMRVGEKISDTAAAQKFYGSDEYAKLKKLRTEVNEFKSEVKEQIDNSPSPVVQVASTAVDKMKNDSP